MSRTVERNNEIRQAAIVGLVQLGFTRATATSIVARMPLMEIVALRLELEQMRSDPADAAANQGEQS